MHDIIFFNIQTCKKENVKEKKYFTYYMLAAY